MLHNGFQIKKITANYLVYDIIHMNIQVTFTLFLSDYYTIINKINEDINIFIIILKQHNKLKFKESMLSNK